MTTTAAAVDQARVDRERDVDQRIANRDERVHILTGAVCNNNCVFCMEEDRDGRYVTNSQTDDTLVRYILDQKKGAEEVCFTSGEPTTNARLPHWVRWAKDAGVRRVSVMTNGRALSYEKYARMLISAGMNRFYISIHGHNEKLHDGLTRTPESFVQTVGGLDVITKYKRYGVELHTSTVITKRNLPFMADIYRFLRSHGVDQVVFNVMQANGRADTYFEHIFPKYTEIAETARVFLEEQGKIEPRVMAFLVDIPLCTTTRLPDFNRGYVESYVHYEPSVNAEKLVPAEALLSRREKLPEGLSREKLPEGLSREKLPEGLSREKLPEGLSRENLPEQGERELVAIRRSDLDNSERQKRAECASCKHVATCEGVWGNYLKRYGWDEFIPVVGP